jgi:imidazolonepropionase-like amidohydrolase
VEAGFKPEEAIRIYTLNGAQYLGQADRIGSIAPGKLADLVVVEGILPLKLLIAKRSNMYSKKALPMTRQS